MPKVKAKERYVFLACAECHRKNYYSHKSRGQKAGAKPAPLQLMKYCRWCRKHTLHKEGK